MFWGAFVSLLYYDTTASLYNSQMFTILMRGCYVTDHSWNDPLDSEVNAQKIALIPQSLLVGLELKIMVFVEVGKWGNTWKSLKWGWD